MQACGIYPFEPQRVLNKLPQSGLTESPESQSTPALVGEAVSKCSRTTKREAKKTTKKRKQRGYQESSDSDEDGRYSTEDSSDEWVEEEDNNDNDNFDDPKSGDQLLVKFPTKNTIEFYVGCIEELVPGKGLELRFVRNCDGFQFIYPEVEDVSLIDYAQKQTADNLRCLRTLLLVIAVSGAHVETSNDSNDGRIVGGSYARIEDHPYQLSFEFQGHQICGASIIGKNWAISAAHCTYGLSLHYLSLRAGSPFHSQGGTVHKVKDIFYDHYVHATVQNDIALLKVDPPFDYSKTVQPISMQSSPVAEGTMGVATGWGVLRERGSKPHVLQQVSLSILNTDKCKKIYQDKGYQNLTHDGQMCTLEDWKDACQGDSGGPLAVDGKLVGITSWGVGCARRENPGVFTDVSYYRGWVKNVTGI
ncbi:trypsin delta-like [Periplaneta americana]|uniref:trypsin delta-like n=1 Tax=Periplaneta americana TaxID=6978 RepID=UPI0037E965FB